MGSGGVTMNSLVPGGSSTGGSVATSATSTAGGTNSAGGMTASGGSKATGGTTTSSGGSKATGGTTTSSGGSKATGGTTASSGGSKATGGNSSTGGATAGGDVKPSSGCGKTPTLKNSPSTANQNTLNVGGKSRQFILRWPDNYDNKHPYRLILGLHGATGKDTDIGPSYFGLFALANNTTIFLAPSADGGFWSAASDTAFVDEILKVVEADLCIDTSRVMLEGFSQGAAMSWTLACSRPGVFRAAIGHSGGGVPNPSTCQPIPYLGSLGLAEGNGQNTQTDQFAKWNGCTITTLPRAPTGGHVCTDYTGCPAADPVRWCSYDGGHTPSPNDAGQSSSWMPKEVWAFVSKF
jgi:poly(3-hydroxybutyrate) depolymerase